MSDERNLPWTYRPRHFDDWGWIRDASGDLAACARGEKGGKTHDEHRADKTDPYGDYAAFIVEAVNSHDALTADIAKLREQLVKTNTRAGAKPMQQLTAPKRNHTWATPAARGARLWPNSGFDSRDGCQFLKTTGFGKD